MNNIVEKKMKRSSRRVDIKKIRKKIVRKFQFEFKKWIYWIIFISIPLVIGSVTHITDNMNDTITKIFYIITFIMYVVGLMLIKPVLNINDEFKLIAKEYKNTVLTEALSDSEKYDEIKDIIEYYNLKFVRSAFNNLDKTLKKDIVIEEGEEKNIYYLTADIECFFNEENILYKNICLKLINQIAQSLTGVGIFGTFLGIIRGVSMLELDNNDYIKQSIIELLNGVKLAFNSSLYGIMFSMILVLVLKITMEITMKNINRVSAYIEDVLSVYTEQRAIEDLKIIVERQSALIKEALEKLEDRNMEKSY